ncbi:MAG: DsbA family protein, partial [Beijerinckiaceae bacterium]
MPRTTLRLFAVSLAFLGFCAFGATNAQPVKPHDALRKAIFNDPEAPIGGNPKGDVTIVAFEDYNCTNCKASEPALRKLVKDDGHIRVVYKDWPIFGKAS